MQERPDKATLLDAVVRFLAGEVLPTASDKGLNFRVLIAANLLTVVAAEMRGDDERLCREAQRLRELLPDVAADPLPAGGEALRESVRGLTKALALKIRDGSVTEDDKAVWSAVRQGLRETLAYANPRFDLRDDVD